MAAENNHRFLQAMSRRWRWLIVAVYTLSIYASLPYGPQIWNFILLHCDKRANYVGVVLLFLLGAYFLFHLIFKEKVKRFYVYLAFFLISLASIVLLRYVCVYPAERFHLLMYGVLSAVVFFAMKLDFKTNRVYVYTTLLAFLLGVFDEIIQMILPMRYFDARDIFLNWISSGLGVLFIIFVLRPGLSEKTTQSRFKMDAYRKLIIIGYIFVLPFFCCARITAKENIPNILLFTIDACRPDHLSCYGYSRNTTPNIDKLAKESVLFTNAFSQSAWTTPGMISIFTSLYPFDHKVDAKGKTLRENIITLPEVLKKNGYSVPVFPRFVNIPNYRHLGFDAVEKERFPIDREEELLKLMEAYKDQRFFIWYHYHGVHLPYNPPSPYDKMFQADIGNKMIADSKSLSLVRKKVVIRHDAVNFRDEDRNPIVALYDGQLRELDDYIGRLIAKMRSWGILNNTIIIITADHGEELLEHGFIGHASTSLEAKLYDEIIRIPLIIRYPKKLSNKKIDVQVQQIDFMPTIMDLIGLPIPDALHGNSLLPLIKGNSVDNLRPIYCETNKGGYQSTKEMQELKIRCVRTKHWKLISTTTPNNDTYELYDLISDPKEKNNVEKEYPDVAANLKKKLHGKIQSAGTMMDVLNKYSPGKP